MTADTTRQGPRFSVAEVSTPHLTFNEDLELYARSGVDGIGISARKITDPTADLGNFRASGLAASVCGLRVTTVLPSPRNGDPTDPAGRVESMCRALDELAPFEPACCIFGPGPYGEYEPSHAWEIAVASLKTVARRAGELGMTVAVEPIHRSISSDFSFITDLPDALALCDDIDEPNVGLVPDIWHLWDTPDFLALLGANVERIAGIQVDDRRATTRSWADRVLPGDGVCDVGSVFSTLRDAGYSGWIDLEIISEGYPDSLSAGEPGDLVAEGLARMQELWNR